MSSHKLEQARKGKGGVPFEVNKRMILFSHLVGGGFSTLEKFKTALGMKGMHLKTFQAHDKDLSATEKVSGEEALQRAAVAIRQAYAETDPDITEALERGETPVVDISVSFDGTWQKRGFTSLFGAGICIDILTGLVIDYQLMSKYCHACKVNENRLSGDDLQAWRESHAPVCSINHTQSSKAMEQEAAKQMWNRSLDKHKLRYVEMLADGDSGAITEVRKLNPYGDIEVEKLECVNHAHKRMGTALRKLARENRLGGRGKGRLTDKKCDILQSYYRKAIIDNTDSVEKMKSAVWAGFYHSISTDENSYHQNCPVGKWCWYRNDLAAGKQPSSHADHPSHTYLSPEVGEKVSKVYHRMTVDSLLSRMQHGGTQNANECLNSQIWLRCPKTTFRGRERVEGALAGAVAEFNEGAQSLAKVMDKVWLDISSITLSTLAAADARRVKKADVATSVQAQQRRKHYVASRRQKRRLQEAEEGETYGAGMAD